MRKTIAIIVTICAAISASAKQYVDCKTAMKEAVKPIIAFVADNNDDKARKELIKCIRMVHATNRVEICRSVTKAVEMYPCHPSVFVANTNAIADVCFIATNVPPMFMQLAYPKSEQIRDALSFKLRDGSMSFDYNNTDKNNTSEMRLSLDNDVMLNLDDDITLGVPDRKAYKRIEEPIGYQG